MYIIGPSLTINKLLAKLTAVRTTRDKRHLVALPISEVVFILGRPTSVRYECSVDNLRQSLTISKEMAIFGGMKTDQKRLSPISGAV